jgi:hypothetical protein
MGAEVSSVSVRLHGGPLDGAVRDATADEKGVPSERVDFDVVEGGTWYAEYRRDREDREGWHFQATGNQERADEE